MFGLWLWRCLICCYGNKLFNVLRFYICIWIVENVMMKIEIRWLRIIGNKYLVSLLEIKSYIVVFLMTF